MVVTVGLKTGDEPDTTYVPAHEPVYQFQFAPVPKLPPVIPSVVAFPMHIGVVPLADVAGVDK